MHVDELLVELWTKIFLLSLGISVRVIAFKCLISNLNFAATSGIPDPDLAFKFGSVQMIMGFLPWQTRLTEFL